MKKTLERLGTVARNSLKDYDELVGKIVEKKLKQDDLNNLMVTISRTIDALLVYIYALQDAYSEFAEGFDKLEAIKLEKMKKAVESIPDKPVKKKDDKGKTKYID